MTLEQLAQPRVPDKMVDLLIGMPTVDSIRTETVASMMNAIYPTLHDHLFLKSAVISDQRDRIGLYAINAKVRLFTHLLFIDSDITFPPEAIKKLINDDKDIVSGLYFKKNVNPQPVAWFTDWKNDGSVKFRPFTCDGSQELVECGAVGMGFCLIKTSVLIDMAANFHTFFQHMNGMGEDLSFCIRAQQLGYKIFVDTSFKLGHVGSYIYDGGVQ